MRGTARKHTLCAELSLIFVCHEFLCVKNLKLFLEALWLSALSCTVFQIPVLSLNSGKNQFLLSIKMVIQWNFWHVKINKSVCSRAAGGKLRDKTTNSHFLDLLYLEIKTIHHSKVVSLKDFVIFRNLPFLPWSLSIKLYLT